MSETSELTYNSYLQLERLLDLQAPVGAGSEPGAELFFIVAHQASELWLKSVLSELDALRSALARCDPPSGAPMFHTRRALAGAKMLVQSVESLRTLDVDSFLRFRAQLGTSSGAQSAQFAKLRTLVGLGKPAGGPIEANLRAMAKARRLAPPDGFAGGSAAADDWFWFLDTLLELSGTIWRWGVYHLDNVQRLIGGRQGTGGTSGVSFLAGRLLDRPFPTLWTAPSADCVRDDGGLSTRDS